MGGFVFKQTDLSSHFFGASAAAPVTVTFSFNVGGPQSATYPQLPPPLTTGDHTGYSPNSGSITPDPTAISGSNIIAIGWSGYHSGQFYVLLTGVQVQTFFASVALGAPANLSFNTSAATFDMSTGNSLWYWPDTHEYTYLGSNLTTVVTL